MADRPLTNLDVDRVLSEPGWGDGYYFNPAAFGRCLPRGDFDCAGTIDDSRIADILFYPPAYKPANPHYVKTHVSAPGTVRQWFRTMRAADFERDLLRAIAQTGVGGVDIVSVDDDPMATDPITYRDDYPYLLAWDAEVQKVVRVLRDRPLPPRCFKVLRVRDYSHTPHARGPLREAYDNRGTLRLTYWSLPRHRSAIAAVIWLNPWGDPASGAGRGPDSQ